jgi:hypothetical protein
MENLPYDMRMRILSELDLWTLHEMEDFKNMKNDKLYELCYDRIKNDASFHKDNWKNELYYGPKDYCTKTENRIPKKFNHFIIFLADSAHLFKLAFQLNSQSHINNELMFSSSIYTYLADQGILGLCCKLYPQFLPDIKIMTTFTPWANECKDGADQHITSLFRPCWELNFNLIQYDRRLCMSMYPNLPFSNRLSEFCGLDIPYIQLHTDIFKTNNNLISQLLHYMVEPPLDDCSPIITNYIISVFTYLKDILDPVVKEDIKIIILNQIEHLSDWATDNL